MGDWDDDDDVAMVEEARCGLGRMKPRDDTDACNNSQTVARSTIKHTQIVDDDDDEIDHDETDARRKMNCFIR